MNIGVLTSSRADFGIYLPLLKQIKSDEFFKLAIIAFGTHLSHHHGKTIQCIYEAGFDVAFKVESLLLTDSPASISTSIGLTTIKFADFWSEHSREFDIVFCLGDRYEMFAAVTAGIPFGIPFAHIHGGEKSLGAMDNIFRHAITLASKYHFVSTRPYAEMVASLTESEKNIYYVGALSLDNLQNMETLTVEQFKEKWGIDLSPKTILFTFHPETIEVDSNVFFVSELIAAINALTSYQILITMPNADTEGNLVRKMLIDAYQGSDRVFMVESLGTQSYFSAISLCSVMLGNTSSGIIEAASFGRYVVNVGDRQKGRIAGSNVINTPIERDSIVDAIRKIEELPPVNGDNIYYNGGASNKIYRLLKENFIDDQE